MSDAASPECSEATDAGGVGKYSVVAVRKVDPVPISNGGVKGALVMSTYPEFHCLCCAILSSICSEICLSCSARRSDNEIRSVSAGLPSALGGILS